MILKFFVSVLVDFNLVLQGGYDYLCVLLEILQLSQYVRVAFLSERPQVIIDAHVL